MHLSNHWIGIVISPITYLRNDDICSISISPVFNTSNWSHLSSNLKERNSSSLSPSNLSWAPTYFLAVFKAPALLIQYYDYLFWQQVHSHPHFLSILSSFSCANPLLINNLINESSISVANLSGIPSTFMLDLWA